MICNLRWAEGNRLCCVWSQVSEANLGRMFKTKRSWRRQVWALKIRWNTMKSHSNGWLQLYSPVATYLTTTYCLGWIWLRLMAEDSDFPRARYPSISACFWEDCSNGKSSFVNIKLLILYSIICDVCLDNSRKYGCTLMFKGVILNG